MILETPFGPPHNNSGVLQGTVYPLCLFSTYTSEVISTSRAHISRYLDTVIPCKSVYGDVFSNFKEDLSSAELFSISYILNVNPFNRM